MDSTCQWLGVEPCRSVGEELVFNSTGTLNTCLTYLLTISTEYVSERHCNVTNSQFSLSPSEPENAVWTLNKYLFFIFLLLNFGFDVAPE